VRREELTSQLRFRHRFILPFLSGKSTNLTVTDAGGSRTLR
jgi:hypothetical protein